MNKLVFALVPILLIATMVSASCFWQHGSWSSCSGGWQHRHWWDNCGHSNIEWQVCGVICTPNWLCSSWSDCTGGTQTRTCLDSNQCGTNVGKPDEVQSCCVPDWQCSDWGTCCDSVQERGCSDGCGNVNVEHQACSMGPSQEELQRQQQFIIHQRMMEALIPNENHPCQMETYVPKNYPPKKVFTACFKDLPIDYVEQWISQYGNYVLVNAWTQYKYTWSWWKLNV